MNDHERTQTLLRLAKFGFKPAGSHVLRGAVTKIKR